jgi:hypothetical protein
MNWDVGSWQKSCVPHLELATDADVQWFGRCTFEVRSLDYRWFKASGMINLVADVQDLQEIRQFHANFDVRVFLWNVVEIFVSITLINASCHYKILISLNLCYFILFAVNCSNGYGRESEFTNPIYWNCIYFWEIKTYISRLVMFLFILSINCIILAN